MSNRTRTPVGPFGGGFDLVAAAAGLVIAIALFPLRFLADELFVEAVPLLLGGGCLVYFAVRRFGREDAVPARYHWGGGTARVLEAASIVGLGALASVGILSGERTLLFHGVSAVVGSLIFAQILFVSDEELRPGTVVFEVVALGLIVRFAALLTTPGLIGVDTWTHVTTYAGAIRDAGTLGAISDSKYFAAPLYHLLVVAGAEAFGTSLKTALYWSLGLAIPLSVVLVYHASRYVLPVRWSLLAMAIFAVCDYVLRWGIDLIPTSMGLVFYLGLFYAATKLFFARDRLPVYALAAFFGIALVLTHQVSTFIALVFLGAGAVAQLLARFGAIDPIADQLRTDRVSSVNAAGLFVVVTGVAVVNWALTPFGDGSFLTVMLGLAGREFASARLLDLRGGSTDTIPVSDPPVATISSTVELIDSIGLFVLLFLVVLGTLYVLQSTHLSQLSLTLVLATSVMLVFAMALPLFGVTMFLPGRWFAFMYAPMAVITALGLRYLTTRLSSRAVLAGLVLLVVVFPGSMFVAHKATPEEQTFDGTYPEYAYSSSELAAVETIQAIHPPSEEYVVTDHPYRTVFERWRGQPSSMMRMGEEGEITARSVVYRQYQTTGTPVIEIGGADFRVHLDRETVCAPSRSIVYDNGDVEYCRAIQP